MDYQLDWKWFNFTPDGARAVLGSLSGSMLTFIVFALSAILLVVQLASGQLTPRIIAPTLAHPLSKIALGTFAFSYTFALGALGRVEDRVPQMAGDRQRLSTFPRSSLRNGNPSAGLTSCR
jgi:uncharacterized membrane protein